VLRAIVSLGLIVFMVKIGLPSPIQNHQTIQISQDEQTNKPQAIAGKSVPVEEAKNKKKKFPWLGILLLVGAAATTIGIMAACKSPSTPTEPPKPIAVYTIKMSFTRMHVRDSSKLSSTPTMYLSIDGFNTVDYIYFPERVDDYNFKGTFSQKRAAGRCYVPVFDLAGGSGADKGYRIVGYKLVAEVLETGSTGELIVVKNTIQGFPDANEVSTMGYFDLTADGQIRKVGNRH
jgi:hypothetical protein